MPVTTRSAVTTRSLLGGLGGIAGVVLVAALAGCAGDAQTPYETPRSSESATFSIPPQTPCPTDGASSSSSTSSSSTPSPDDDANCSTGVPATGDDGQNVDNEGDN